jgi:hypothetical protein
MTDFNYKIVLFKNKEKKKIINKFITSKKALKYFNYLIDKSDNVLFEMMYENGGFGEYEIALIEKNIGPTLPLFVKDDYGRQIKIEVEDNKYKISRIVKYRIEEEFLDYSTKKKIDTKRFISSYLSKDGLKLLSKLNNKIVLQNDNDINLFTFKNIHDSERFLEVLSEHFIKNKRYDCIFVKDSSTIQRKYLYDILIERGFSRSYLFRLSTTHPR